MQGVCEQRMVYQNPFSRGRAEFGKREAGSLGRSAIEMITNIDGQDLVSGLPSLGSLEY